MMLAEKSAAGAGARVLVVEDDPWLRRALGRYLEHAGYTVRTASTMAQALSTLEDEDPFHALVVDLQLPGGSGLQVLASARKQRPETRLILMSGCADVPSAAAAVEQGIDALVTKPFPYEEMGARVDEAVARYRASAAEMHRREQLEARLRQRDTESKLWMLRAAHALAHAVEAKDPYTAGHARRVTGYALRMAEASGGIDLDRFRLAGNLHDVGKIGVPDAILNKPARLEPDEMRHVRRHPRTGSRILEPLIDDPMVIGVVLWHHERWDGQGYPDGLRGADIPLAARILAVADTLDAMTSSRSYRPALPWSAAVAEIRAGAGTQFDPRIVAVFDAVLPELEALFRQYREEEMAPSGTPPFPDWAGEFGDSRAAWECR
ncbi:MAG TPA: HD domain-containing phosphohydrolase [Longimicrobium sp.]|jgi:response regulator RpfG family c-di-GMP phosphodiesterase|nr:HD domain-containing phosphohydrolase [Longimicrobium sp.]